MTQKELIRQEIDKWVEEHLDCPETSPMRKHYEPILQWGKNIAHKFYELGKQNKEHVSEDLEEAADEYADKHGFRVPYDGSNNYYDDVDVKASKEGFLAGAEWQKEQMMKEAVESEVVITSGGILLRDLRIEDFDYEDKVKIIIVKK